MFTIKAIAVVVALIASTAVVTYTATTTFVTVEPVTVEPVAAVPDDACQAVLAELQAAREKAKAQEEAFKKYANGKQFELGRGKGF